MNIVVGEAQVFGKVSVGCLFGVEYIVLGSRLARSPGCIFWTKSVELELKTEWCDAVLNTLSNRVLTCTVIWTLSPGCGRAAASLEVARNRPMMEDVKCILNCRNDCSQRWH